MASLLLPLIGFGDAGLCLKEKEFTYRPDIQYQNVSSINSCYITKEEFSTKQKLPGFILGDIRSVYNQQSHFITSAVPYSAASLKPLLSERKLDVTLITDKSSLLFGLALCSNDDLVSKPSLIPYGVRGAQAYGLLVQPKASSSDIYSIESYLKQQSSKLENMWFVIPANVASRNIFKSINTIVVETIDLDFIHKRMAKEKLGQSIAVIPRRLFRGYSPDNDLLHLYPEIFHLNEKLVSFVDNRKPKIATKKIIQKGC